MAKKEKSKKKGTPEVKGEKKGKPEVKAGRPEEKKRPENIIRFMETTIDGDRPVKTAIKSIKGVGFMLGSAISKLSGFADKKIAELTEEEQSRLEDMLANPGKFGVPEWMFNRRRDPASGEIKHLMVSNLQFTNRMDINELKRIKCYKGVRHTAGLPVRGQRTRSSFRKGKTVGVSRSKANISKAKK